MCLDIYKRFLLLIPLFTCFQIPVYAHEPEPVKKEYFSYPGEPVAEDSIRVILMGTSYEPRPSQAACSIYVELGNGDVFVFDFGAGSIANYNAMGIPPWKLDKIFLSHLHVDHFTDLIYLYGMGPGLGRYTPLSVWGPAAGDETLGISSAMEAMQSMTAWHRESFHAVIPVGEAYSLDIHEIEPAQTSTLVYSRDGVNITAFPALHIMNGAVSYRVDWKGNSFVYSGDTSPSRFMIENAQGIDLLVHEVRSPVLGEMVSEGTLSHEQDKDRTNTVFNTFVHTDASDLGELLERINPAMTVLNHVSVNSNIRVSLVDKIRQAYSGDIRIAEDLMVFDIGPDGVRQRMGVGPERPLWGNFPVPENTAPAKGLDSVLDDWLRNSSLLQSD